MLERVTYTRLLELAFLCVFGVVGAMVICWCKIDVVRKSDEVDREGSVMESIEKEGDN